jgi:hypothetical protein
MCSVCSTDRGRHDIASDDELYGAMRNVEIALELMTSLEKFVPFIEA